MVGYRRGGCVFWGLEQTFEGYFLILRNYKGSIAGECPRPPRTHAPGAAAARLRGPAARGESLPLPGSVDGTGRTTCRLDDAGPSGPRSRFTATPGMWKAKRQRSTILVRRSVGATRPAMVEDSAGDELDQRRGCLKVTSHVHALYLPLPRSRQALL